MVVGSRCEVNWVLWVGGLLIFFVWGYFLFVGIVLFVFYWFQVDLVVVGLFFE